MSPDYESIRQTLMDAKDHYDLFKTKLQDGTFTNSPKVRDIAINKRNTFEYIHVAYDKYMENLSLALDDLERRKTYNMSTNKWAIFRKELDEEDEDEYKALSAEYKRCQKDLKRLESMQADMVKLFEQYGW